MLPRLQNQLIPSISMVDFNLLSISLVPSLSCSIVSTGGFVGWIRLRKGFYPRRKDIGAQLLFSFGASLLLSYQWLQSKRRSREALLRMKNVTDGLIEIRSPGSGAVPIPPEEFDRATGMNAEEENRKLFKLVEKK